MKHNVSRSHVTTEWSLWTKVGEGTHAVLMDRDDGTHVWVSTDAATAHTYARINGAEFAAEIMDEKPWSVVDTERVSGRLDMRVMGRFDTQAEAEAFIAGLAASTPAVSTWVAQGRYSIDGPEAAS